MDRSSGAKVVSYKVLVLTVVHNDAIPESTSGERRTMCGHVKSDCFVTNGFSQCESASALFVLKT